MSRSAQAEASESSSVLESSVVCSSDEASHVSGSPETAQPCTATKPEMSALPEDIEDDLNDANDDVPLDIANVSKEELFQIHSKISDQRNSYRRKCVQVSKLF